VRIYRAYNFLLKHMAAEDEESEDYRTSILIPKSLQKTVAHYCIDHELTFTDAVIEALREYMAKHNRSPTR
jgi:hypothetical protein